MMTAKLFKERQEAIKDFSSVVGGQNFLTQNTVDFIYSDSHQFVSEIAYGTGFASRWLVGVTVVRLGTPNEKSHSLSTCFSNDDKQVALKQAREYAKEL